MGTMFLESHRDLVERPPFAHLASIRPDGGTTESEVFALGNLLDAIKKDDSTHSSCRENHPTLQNDGCGTGRNGISRYELTERPSAKSFSEIPVSSMASLSTVVLIMRERPAGDFDYEVKGQVYSSVRQPEPRFGAAIRNAFGDAQRILNVGAGAGSYEPDDLDVVAVEPSATMRAQRPKHLTEAIDAVAEDLPFADNSFDASLASITIHQWKDLGEGLKEMRRVTKGPVVILTFEPVALKKFWLSDYAPEMMEYESGRMPSLDVVAGHLGGRVDVSVIPIPHDCLDGFAEAFFGRPEAFLDERVRSSQSAWGFVTSDVERSSVAHLKESLDDGSWDRRHERLRSIPSYDGSLRLLVANP